MHFAVPSNLLVNNCKWVVSLKTERQRIQSAKLNIYGYLKRFPADCSKTWAAERRLNKEAGAGFAQHCKKKDRARPVVGDDTCRVQFELPYTFHRNSKRQVSVKSLPGPTKHGGKVKCTFLIRCVWLREVPPENRAPARSSLSLRRGSRKTYQTGELYSFASL